MPEHGHILRSISYSAGCFSHIKRESLKEQLDGFVIGSDIGREIDYRIIYLTQICFKAN